MEIVGTIDKRKKDAFGSELSGSSKKAKGASKPTVPTSNRQSTVLELQAAENLVTIANEREETSAALLELRQENVEEWQLVGDQVQIESEQGQTKELEVEQSGRESDKNLERTASDQGFKGCIPRITNQVRECGASLPTILDKISMEKQQDVLEEVRRTRNILNDLSEDTNTNLILLGMVFELQEKLILAKESMKKQLAGFCQEYENLQCKLESLKERIDQRVQQIEEQEAQHELEQRNLLLQIEENAIGNSAMKLAALKPKNAEENVMKLAEDQRRQKEELHNRITQLEKHLDQKQALGVEIEQLRGSFKEFKNMGEEEEALRKLEETLQELKAKEKELENLAALNQTLIVKERESSNELQARNALLIKLEAANKALTDENKEMREKYAQKEDQCKSLEISLNSLVDKEKMSTLELQNARNKLISVRIPVPKTQKNGVQERQSKTQSKKQNTQDRGTQDNKEKKAQNKRVQETQNDGVKETQSKAENNQAQKTQSKKKNNQVRGTQNNGVQKTKKGADVDLHVYDSDDDIDNVLVLEQ